ncbi:MAG TPA: restriction endonuclease [Candidatus Competibacter sp.]|nr:restriction endonuclease [Candidatus Competibacter sp.]
MRRRNPVFAPPWWVALLLVPLSYWLLAGVLPRWQIPNPYLHMVFVSAAPVLAPFVAVGFLLMAGALGLARWQRRRWLDRHRSLEALRAMRWQDFEQLVGEYYRRRGFRVQETGGGGADGGIDLVLERDGETWLVQCKRFAHTAVGVKPVRELLGVVAGERATGGIFIATSAFTREATAFARGQKLELVDGETLLERVEAVRAVKTIAPSPEPAERPADAAKAPAGSAVPTPPAPVDAPAVRCPKCGSSMVRRTAKRGVNAGQPFWGCTKYPACRGTRAI